ncbi:uncharacterized protein [Malus domestica]|uniref:uncharacterized protein n=1 Tax=Malus domestica TaxID=3750 RepID=UPI003975F6A4
MKDNKGLQRVNRTTHRANHAFASTSNGFDPFKNFIANPVELMNEFMSYLQGKKGGAGIDRADSIGEGNSTALLGKFAGFLADTKPVPQENMQDSGATDHMTNHVSKSQKFEKFTNPSQVSIANGESVKGYKCYNPQLRRLIVAKDVRFHETNHFFSKSHEITSQGDDNLDMFPLPRIELEAPQQQDPSHVNIDASLNESSNEGSHSDGTRHEDGDNQDDPHNTVQNANECETTFLAPRRNPMRVRKTPTRLQDFVIYKPTHLISHCVSYKRVTPAHAAFLSTISSYKEPQNFHEANNQEVWKEAMQEELC